jgi:hypothetical protein
MFQNSRWDLSRIRSYISGGIFGSGFCFNAVRTAGGNKKNNMISTKKKFLSLIKNNSRI